MPFPTPKCGYGVWGSAKTAPAGLGGARPPDGFWYIFSAKESASGDQY